MLTMLMQDCAQIAPYSFHLTFCQAFGQIQTDGFSGGGEVLTAGIAAPVAVQPEIRGVAFGRSPGENCIGQTFTYGEIGGVHDPDDSSEGVNSAKSRLARSAETLEGILLPP